jgi:tripartite-type tricarboxylate transporter receptor subunit TctC
MTTFDDSRSGPTRRRVLKGAAALAAGITAPAVLRVRSALAAYPDRPVRIIVANSPGGPSDIMARTMAAAMTEVVGKSFYVENKGGAGGNLGMGLAARSEPDGYTILLTTSAYVINPGLYEKLPYDPFKDFVPVCELATSPHVFAVLPKLGAKTMKEFVALAKANPDKFNVSTPPIGTSPQLQAEVLKQHDHLEKMASVVFKGGGDALKALLDGTVQLSSGVLAPAHPHIKSGRITGLAVTGSKRWHDLPDIPTMLEVGYKDFVFETYTAFVAPAKVPPEIVKDLEKVSLDILNKPAMREKLTQSGFDVQAKDGKGHLERIKREVKMYHDIIEGAHIKKL